MNPSWQMIVVGAALFATMAAYALFAGADLGAGIWDALAGGERRGAAPRAAIRRSITPVWEANNVWIIFGLVILWTAFPTAFAAITTTLFVPLALSLLGIVLRGTGFAFRNEADRLPAKALTTALFAGSSVIAPFFLGAAVGAVATGAVRPDTMGESLSAWTSSVALITGALFVTSCAFIGAVYLVEDCQRRGHRSLTRYFARRALLTGAATGALAAANLVVMHDQARYVFQRLLHTAWPLVAASVLAGAAALVLILIGFTRALRPVAAVAVAAVVAAWGWAQYPYLFPRTLTLSAASAPPTTLNTQLVIIGAALVLVGPAFGCLYWLQQHGELRAGNASSKQLREAVAAENHPLSTGAKADSVRTHRLVTAVVLAAAAAELARDAITTARARRQEGRR